MRSHRPSKKIPTLACSLALAYSCGTLQAQVAPNAEWRTIRTPHANIHFVAGMEELARRTAANAERAYAQLSQHLHAPRGPIDIVLSDDVDFSNGAATPVPTNRVYVYAAPPVDPGALRYTRDWNELVVVHELAHIFHLDRARGPLGLTQRLLGRAPFLFPNLFGPSWLTEGIAVWYESELTGAGRLRGSEHRMIARASALQGRLPRLDEISLGTPRFPGGQSAYAYGSLFIEYLAQRSGPRSIRDFVERQSTQLVPFWINRPARRAFHDSFDRLWQRYSDSLVAASQGGDRPPMLGWRTLVRGDLAAGPPRWSGDSLLQSGAPGRLPFAIRSVSSEGEERRGGRRWTVSPQVPLADGGVLYAQLDFRDLYRIRSDLWIERDGRRQRITTGARLAYPDARRDGAIVAVQGLPGGTRLVRVTADGSRITPITTGGPDTNWSEPRWSPDGTRIAAVRWTRPGTTTLMVLDSAGTISRDLVDVGEGAVLSSPSWSPDGRQLLYISDEGGVPNIRVASFDGSDRRLVASDAATGLLYPELSPDGRTIAAVHFRADGYELGVAPLDSSRARPAPARRAASLVTREAADSGGPVASYSAWRTVLPRWWLPVIETGLDDVTRVGALTAGSDVIGRHHYSLDVAVPVVSRHANGPVGGVAYRFAGLGRPLLDLSLSQNWESRGNIVSRDFTQVLGELRRRSRDAQMGLVYVRPRMRSSSSLSLLAGLEERAFATLPESLARLLSPPPRTVVRPRVAVNGSWSRVDRAAWSISPEDGGTLAASALRRWRRGVAGTGSHTVVGAATGYKSLDLPGFSRHVLAARLAAGATDRRTTSALEVGGTGGGTIALFPGQSLGDGRRTFGVRGFPGASVDGIRAISASAEYRAPLILPARGFELLPLFLERTALAVFADAGSAWCPDDQAERGLCRYTGPDDMNAAAPRDGWRTIASVGAELHVNLAVLSWDQPYRLRFGVAVPVQGREAVDAKPVSAYFAVGLAY